jgi:hypothetical protein
MKLSLALIILQGFEFDIFVEANYKLVLSWTCSWDEVEYVDKDLLEHLDAAISRSLSLPAPAHMLFNMKIPCELYRDWVDSWWVLLPKTIVTWPHSCAGLSSASVAFKSLDLFTILSPFRVATRVSLLGMSAAPASKKRLAHPPLAAFFNFMTARAFGSSVWV